MTVKELGRFEDRFFSHFIQVDLFYEQIHGLNDGYNVQVKAGRVPAIPPDDIFFMNIFGDMEDLSTALVQIHGLNVTLDHVLGDGHCSALIKLLPGRIY